MLPIRSDARPPAAAGAAATASGTGASVAPVTGGGGGRAMPIDAAARWSSSSLDAWACGLAMLLSDPGSSITRRDTRAEYTSRVGALRFVTPLPRSVFGPVAGRMAGSG
jgi:hypothetical protein